MGARFRMTIGPDPGQVARVSTAFDEFARAHRVPVATRRSVSIALDELLTNTLAYGFAGRADGEVSVEVELLKDRVCATVRDNGPLFNPLEMNAPDTGHSVEDRTIGGLGIHLIRQMMDEVVYERRDDHNVVSLAKLLPRDGQ